MKKDTKPMLGGLNTKLPPVMLPREESPDQLNTVMRDGEVRKRGGFVPHFRDRMLGDAVQNRAFRAVAAADDSGASADVDFLTSPGYMIAGDRPIYSEGLSGNGASLLVALWFQPTRLYAQQGGLGRSDPTAPYFPAPFQVRVLPIISKGPVKKTDEPMASGVTDATEWGDSGIQTEGMPFCVYLFNSGTGTAPAWSFRLSAHFWDGAAFSLRTVTSTVPVVEGARYHIIAAMRNQGLSLRIARYVAGESPSYVQVDNIAAGFTICSNECPIQVFDCPQKFIDQTASGSATKRPGLGIGTAATGMYWYAKLRPDAKVDDISMWKWQGDSLALWERATKVPVSPGLVGGSRLISLWSMGGSSNDYVREETGLGNHLMFVPRGPVSVADDDGKEGGSWFHNGTTSYTQLDVETPNWRRRADDGGSVPPERYGAMWALMQADAAHGISVEFWLDSIEPTHTTVIAEVHGVMLLGVNTSGFLIGVCRNNSATGDGYGAAVTSSVRLRTGKRYQVTLMRRQGGTNLDLYIDDVLDATAVVVARAVPVYPPGGVTLGMGSTERLTHGATALATDIAIANQVAMDSTTGFVGRIETFRIIASPQAPTIVQRHGPEDETSWSFPESLTWKHPEFLNWRNLRPSDVYDTARQAGRGAMMRSAAQAEDGVRVVGVILNSWLAGAPPFLELQSALADLRTGLMGSGVEGNFELEGIGIKVFHTLCYYRFNRDDRDNSYPGSYRRGLEWRYPVNTPLVANQARHPSKHTHLQFSEVGDAIGHLGNAFRCCSESDVMREGTAQVFATNGFFTHRLRPYASRTPIELGPQWSTGIALPQPGTNPVTLLASYDVQTDNRNLTIVGCGRTLFWAKPEWDDGYLFFAGGIDSYVHARVPTGTMAVTGSTPKTQVSFSAWVKPLRLDGLRVIASRSDASGNRTINWMVFTDNGAITVLGQEGSRTRAWRFVEGNITGGPTDVSRSNSLKVGVWNHLHVVIGTTGVTVRVRGQVVPMVNTNSLTGALRTDAFGASTSDAVLEDFLIGGLPDSYERVSLPITVSASTITLTLESWYGSIADVALRDNVDLSRWPLGLSGFPPPIGANDDTALAHYWKLNEGIGWRCANSVIANATFTAEVRIHEFYPLAYGLQQEEGRSYRSVAFRDRLNVTNGAENPQQIAFAGFQTTKPLSVTRLGMAPPVAVDIDVLATITAGAGIVAGNYQVVVSFVNSDGQESDPTLLTVYDLGADCDQLILRITGLPRSPDPQVVARRLYLSATGGGPPLLNRDIRDNDSWDADMIVYTGAATSPIAGEKLPAPRARHCALAGTSLVLADLPDLPAGQNAVAFSTTNEISQFSILSNATIIDSEDGKPITGIAKNLSQAFLSKSSQIFGIGIGAIIDSEQIDASIQIVHASDGIGGGTAAASNLLYGAGDRGVFIFNNTEAQYISDKIEPTWRREIDFRPEGLYAMQGVFWRSQSQYWISVRRTGQTLNDTILVFDMNTTSWWRCSVPPHVSVRIVQRSDSSEQFIAIGTDDGRVLVYDEDMLIDGASSEANRFGAVTLQGTVGLSGTANSLVVAGGNFPTIMGGLQGVTVTLVHDGITEQRRITSNDATTLRWETPLTGFASFTSFVVGAFPGYWTSAWIHDGPLSREQKLNRIAIEMRPQATPLQLDVSSIQLAEAPDRPWPVAFESTQVPQLRGYDDRPYKSRSFSQGQYHRFRFGTYGIQDPFALIGYSPDFEVSVSNDQTGRKS